MLTDLGFLNEGEQFPPDSESDRLDMYANNRKLFENGHGVVYEESLKRIQRVIGNFEEVISYPVIINFQKLMSLKIADLLLGEPPKFSHETSKDTLEEIVESQDLINTAYMIAIDVSRYGDGLFFVSPSGISLTQPPIWFPVVSQANVRDIQYHVLAWADKKKLSVQIHGRGWYETRKLELDEKGIIQGILEPSKVVKTGLSDFAVIPVPNVLTSDRVCGLDDYTTIDSIVSDLIVRIGQVDRILDKHADPSMSGPATALERDPVTGKWQLKTGTFFPRESSEDPAMEYITWNGQLEANFKQIERLINILYMVSEMGAAVFGDLSGGGTGNIASGSALRRLMMSPLAKVNRIRMRFDRGIKKALKLYGESIGVDLDGVDITWQDGLPGDPAEEATIMSIRTSGKPTMSQKRALKTYDAMSEEDAESELLQIQDEEATNVPTPTAFPNLEEG